MKRYLLAVCALGLVGWMQRPAPPAGPPRPLEFWAGAAPDQVRLYPRPTPVTRVARATEIPRLALGTSGRTESAAPPESNEAVRLAVTGVSEQSALFGTAAEPGETFVVLATRWENIHPKEKVSKAALEGKADRTMGVGGLAGGAGRGGKTDEYVEMDVAYKVPRLLDHLYLLADGQAVPLHGATASLPGGADPEGALVIAKQGERRDLQLAFLAPERAENLALQLFDYSNGHVLIPLRGSLERARGSGGPSGDVLGRASTEVVELAALALRWSDEYGGVAAAPGWRFAVVTLGGRSLSGGGGMGDILQLDPTKYVWVTTDGGYLYYATGGSTDAKGLIRFTPEIYQQQEVAFRVPEAADRLVLGVRVNRDVVTLDLTKRAPKEMPSPRARYRDGDVMEVLLFDARREGDYFIVELGIQPIVEAQGIEVRAAQQFLLRTPEGELRPDPEATTGLAGHPPEPFVVPPGTSVRFELAYRTGASPEALRIRGFRSEGRFDF